MKSMKLIKQLLVGVIFALATVFTVSPAFAADGVFNITKGRVNELVNRVDANDPANSVLVVELFQTIEADATLEDYDSLSAMLAGSNTLATFTNYAPKVLTDTDVAAAAVNDTANNMASDIPDQVWTAAGGTLDNTLVKLVIFYDPDSTGGTDADLIPLVHLDFATTTNGNDLTAVMAATGFFVAD